MRQQVLIAGSWQLSQATGYFRAANPATKSPIDDEYPISSWAECEAAIAAAAVAFEQLRQVSPAQIAAYLEAFAARIEANSESIVAMANQESALPVKPRLADVELPRTTGQLRQAAAAAREQSWAMPTIDTKANIRSMLAPIGPVCVFGPNNFPLAFNSVAGGDFVAAIATGCPVIAKANSSHPGTTRLLAEHAHAAAQECKLPAGTVQLLYRTSHDDGKRLVSDPRVGATGYTGSRSAGLELKSAADAAGKLIYLELSSVNPVIVLPGAIAERGADIAGELAGSCLMGTGQFCTSPGVLLAINAPETEAFTKTIVEKLQAAPVGVLLSEAVERSLTKAVAKLQESGATLVTGGKPGAGNGYSFANTLLRATGKQFLANPHGLQTEAFGNATLLVVVDDVQELLAVIDSLEGNLTGTIYSARSNADDACYATIEPALRLKVGRLLNDKPPTGVAVSPAMNHGGPYPSTGHAGFTAVGIPAALRRFAVLQCYDAVRPERLPELLRDTPPAGKPWRLIDGEWKR